MALEDLGDLIVSVGGDLSPLEAALESIPASVSEATAGTQAAFDALGAAMDAPVAAAQKLGTQLSLLDESIGTLGTDASGQLSLFSEWANAIELVAPATQQAADGLKQVAQEGTAAGPALANLAPAVEEADASFLKMATDALATVVTFQTIKQAAEELVTEYGLVEKAEISLSSTAGISRAGAEEQIASVKELANSLGILEDSAIKAQSRLVAFGVDIASIPETLTAIQAAAIATNGTFDNVAQRLGSIAEAGNVSDRTLVQFGLHMADLGTAMGLTDASSKEIKKTFQDIGDTATRADVIVQAIYAKWGDLADQAANTTEASWNRVKNSITSAFQDIGKQLDGFKGLADFADVAIKGLEIDIQYFIGGLKVLVDGLIGFGQIASDVFTGFAAEFVALANHDFKGAVDAMRTMIANITDDSNYATQQMTADWLDTFKAVDKVHGVLIECMDDFPKLTKTITPATEALKGLDKQVATFEQHALDLLATMPTSVEGFANAVADGGKNIKSSLSQIETSITNAIKLMNELKTVPTDLLEVYGKLIQMQDQLKQLSEDQTLAKIAQQVSDLVAKFPAQVQALDAATQQWIAKQLELAQASITTENDMEMLQRVLKTLEGAANSGTAASQALSIAYANVGDKASTFATNQNKVNVAVGSSNFVGPLQAATGALNDHAAAHDRDAAATTRNLAVQQKWIDFGPTMAQLTKGLVTDWQGVVDQGDKVNVSLEDQVALGWQVVGAWQGVITESGQLIDASKNVAGAVTGAAGAIQVIDGNSSKAKLTIDQLSNGIQVLNGHAGTATATVQTAADTIGSFNVVVGTATGATDALAVSWNGVAAAARGASTALLQAGEAALAAAQAALSSMGGPGGKTGTFGSSKGIGGADPALGLPGSTPWNQSISENVGANGTVTWMGQTIQTTPGVLSPGTSSGGSGNATDPAAAIAAQIQAETSIVNAMQAELDKISTLYQQGNATIYEVSAAQKNLKTAQDQLSQLLATAGVSTDNTDTALSDFATQLSQTTLGTQSLTSAISTLTDTASTAADSLTQAATMTVTAAVLGSQLVSSVVAAITGGSSVGGITPINTSTPNLNLPALTGQQYASGGLLATAPGGVTVNVSVQAGVVAGNDGLAQLSQLTAAETIRRLRGVIGLKL